MTQKGTVFVAGGTGHLGKPLVSELLRRGHSVKVLVRPESKGKLAPGCVPVVGNALDPSSYVAHIQPSDTLVQLVGVSHPGSAKATEFRNIDLRSGLGVIEAGLVTLGQMTEALVAAVETKSTGVRIYGVPEIRASSGFHRVIEFA